MILLESRVFEQCLQEIAADGQCRACTLSEGTCAEVNAAIFAADPCADNQLGTHAHEPCIGVVVARSSLSAKLGVAVVTYVTPQRLRGSTWLFQSSLQHLLHEEGALVGDDRLTLRGADIHLIAVFVDDARHEHGIVVAAVVGNDTIGIHHL